MEAASRLDEIKRTLSPDQLRYLQERVLCRTDAEAARNCGLAPITVYKWNENTPIQEAVNLLMDEGLQVSLDIMRRNLARAAKVKVSGLDSKKEAVKQAAATEILDRFHGRPKQQSDINVSGGPLTINLTWGDTESDGADRDVTPTA